MKIIRTTMLAAALVGLSSAASADVIGFSAGIGYWGQAPSGTIDPGNNSGQWDVKDDFGLDNDHKAFVWAALEHPIPVLPNIRLEYTPMALTGNGTLSQSIEFQGTTYNASENVHSELTLNQTDIILYYELLDNWVNLDVGLNAKYVDGKAKVVGDQSGTEDVTFKGLLPLLYVNARFDIPATGLFLGAQASGIAYSGNQIVDWRANVGYSYSVFAVEAGWRGQQVKLNNVDNVDANIKVGGPYAAVSVDF